MKEGLHLGPPRPKLPGVVRGLIVASAAVAVSMVLLVARTRREAAELRQDVERLTEESPAPAGAASNANVASSLETVIASGLLDAVAPTDALRLVSSSLPDGMVLVSLSLDASPPNRALTLEATATSAEDVTELQRRIAASSMVSSTILLEERRLRGGVLSVRLQVDLLGGGAP